MGHTMQVLSFPSPRSTPAEGDVQSATMDLHPSPVDSAQRYHPRSPARASSRESRSPHLSLYYPGVRLPLLPRSLAFLTYSSPYFTVTVFEYA